MTREDALALAQAKWGDAAYTRHVGTHALNQFEVGCPGKECALGQSWEDACKRAGLIE